MTSKEFAEQVSDRVKNAGDNADWYLALLATAMDETHDRSKALTQSDEAFQRQPTMPDDANQDLTEEDAHAVNF